MMDIFVVRHGESTGNGQGRIMGWADHPLTERGQEQADAVAERLKGLGPMTVICSDLCRARATAEAIAAHWGGAVESDARWREINCGCYEGKTWDEYTADVEMQQKLIDDPIGACLPEGESVAMLMTRVAAAFTELIARKDERMVVVSHDGAIRSLLAHLLELPPGKFWTLQTDHCGLTRITVTDGWVAVRGINDISHLEVLAHA